MENIISEFFETRKKLWEIESKFDRAAYKYIETNVGLGDIYKPEENIGKAVIVWDEKRINQRGFSWHLCDHDKNIMILYNAIMNKYGDEDDENMIIIPFEEFIKWI